MAISFRRYVDITSGVAGSAAVASRSLMARLFTSNALLPPASYIEFDNASDVGSYFGTSSAEYLRALFYFGFVSKSITSPKKISYARWVNTAVAPVIYGAKSVALLATLNAITAGAFTMTLGGVGHTFTAIDLSAAGSFAAVATAIQTKIQASGGGTLWTSATVAYDATRASFNFTGGVAGAASIVVADGAQNVAAALGWLPQATGAGVGAIWGAGAAVETVTQTLQASADASDNFGSFDFMPTMVQADVVLAALWNDAQNEKFQYHQSVAAADASAWSAAIIGYSGAGLTLNAVGTEYPEMLPMAILGATDYERRNAAQNYMFQTAQLTPSVTTDTAANTYDALRVNYYGKTQTAGRDLSFYQRGFLMGGSSDALDMGVYANEQWLKDAAGVALMSLLLAVSQVPANSSGRAQILSVLQSVIDAALFNGTISVGKTLTSQQIVAVTNATGDATAWRQVQNAGYWVDVVIAPVTGPDNVTEYKAIYTLVYSKNDSVRKVEGSHILI